MSENYRNHPVVLVKSASAYLILIIILYFMGLGTDARILILSAGIFCLLWAVSVFVWRRTFVFFDDAGIRYVRNTILNRMDKSIPYTRLASIGVTRTLLDRLVGTTVLSFNVNSSVDSTVPEVTLTLKSTVADRLRDDLNRKVFVKEETIEVEKSKESLIKVSDAEILLHSIFSQSTAQLLWGVILLCYSIYSMLDGKSGGLIASLFLLVISSVYPMISSVLSYCNYRLYRIGDTITVESGLLKTSRTSFKVSKINSVRVRRPLIARIFGMATLEAEVVGLRTAFDSSVPLLCPLKPESEVRSLMKILLPEVVFDTESRAQPRRAIIPLLIVPISVSVVSVCAAFIIGNYGSSVSDDDIMIQLAVPILGLLVPAFSFVWAVGSHRVRRFDAGEMSFMATMGSFDVCEQYVLYDKIQFASVFSGPIQRFLGLSRLRVHVLSSSGEQRMDTGMFEPVVLDHVMEEVLGRISDGRYDYREYE